GVSSGTRATDEAGPRVLEEDRARSAAAPPAPCGTPSHQRQQLVDREPAEHPVAPHGIVAVAALEAEGSGVAELLHQSVPGASSNLRIGESRSIHRLPPRDSSA